MAETLEYLKLIGVLALVVGAAYVALRFWLPKLSGMRAVPKGPLRIAWSLALEPRKTLYVVRAGSDYLLVAASEAGVQFLTFLDEGGMERAE